jgi:Domain of unknown function (DUF1896)
MQEILINKLLEYIRDNNPDILFVLEAEATVTIWLSEKVSAVDNLIIQLKEQQQPDYEIEETCMDIITKSLHPSKYNYICNIVEEEFEQYYQQLLQTGLLQHEVINMIHDCQSAFDDLKFSEETEDNQFLHYTIIGAVSDYLNSENENVSHELQQPTETAG